MAELNLYDVTIRGFVTQMQLSDEDAELLYGDDAKKVGKVETTTPEPVAVPSFGDDPESGEEPGEKRVASTRNKARSTDK